MKRYFISIFFCVFLFIGATAQIDQEIRLFVDSTELIVNNGRKLLIKKIEENDNLKAKEIFDYLNDITSKKSYSAFNYTEEIYINLLICDWFKLSQLMSEFGNEFNKTPLPNVSPISKNLYDLIVKKSDSLMVDNQNNVVDSENRKINEILIHLLKTGQTDEQYNQMLKDFNNEFKPSKYSYFVKQYLPPVRIKLAYAWSIGSGMVLTTGKLADNFRPNASVNISMDINVGNVFSSLYLNASGLKLKVPFSATSGSETLNFEKNETFHYLNAGLKGGYFFVRDDRFHLAPYLSISGSFLESKRYEPEDDEKEFQIFNSFTYGFGLNAEIKIKDFTRPNFYTYYGKYYISVKLDGGYNFIAKSKHPEFKGDTPFFSVAFVMGFGEF